MYITFKNSLVDSSFAVISLVSSELISFLVIFCFWYLAVDTVDYAGFPSAAFQRPFKIAYRIVSYRVIFSTHAFDALPAIIKEQKTSGDL